MIAPNIPSLITTDVRSRFDVFPSGQDRYVVRLPFMFDDGDHFAAVVRLDAVGWYIADEGTTLSHIKSSFALTPHRREVITQCLAEHGVENVGGELRRRVEEDDWSEAIFSFVQAIAQAVTIKHWTKEQTAKTFVEDVETAIRQSAPPGTVHRHWHDRDIDPNKNYTIDFYVPDIVPWFIFAGTTAHKCTEAALAAMVYRDAGMDFRGVAFLARPRLRKGGVTVKAEQQLSKAGVEPIALNDRAMMVEFLRGRFDASRN